MDRKYSYPLITTILCFIFLTSVSQVSRTDCRPNGYVQTFRNNLGSNSQVATYWFRDGQGRLVADSLYSLDSLASYVPHTTVHYYYKNDSVIGIGNDGRLVLILLNSNKLPTFTSDPENRTLNAFYNNDGELIRVDEMREDKEVYIDSVVYREGNIISFRVAPFNFTTTFKYYKNKSGASIYGNQKPYALRSTRIFNSMIDVQALSKNLLKSVSYEKIKTISFIYKFDKNGKVHTMKRVVRDPTVGKNISNYNFLNPCD